MRSGALRIPAKIVRPVGVDDFGRGEVTEHVVREEVHAEIMPTSAAETVQGGQTTHAITHTVKVRSNPDAIVDATCVLVTYNGRRFEIRGVEDVGERRRELLLQCVEVTRGDGG